MNKKYLIPFLISFLALATVKNEAQDKFQADFGADLVSRYIWRGIDVASTPNIQPSFSAGYKGIEFGLWASYTFSNQSANSDEIDAWLSYSLISSGGSFTAILIDYYFPNSGVRLGNFNNYDNPKGAGAHLLEFGLQYHGMERFPFYISGYYNFYNDAGNNTYIESGYSTSFEDIGFDFFIGAALGSKENPEYYTTHNFAVINLGIKASKEVYISDKYHLPVFTSVILNPRVEILYLVFGIQI